MAPVATTRSGKSSRSVFQGVLLAGLLAAGIIIGLLAMHTLNLHGTAAADAPAAVSASDAAPADSLHVGAAGHDSGHGPGDREASCAGCGTHDHTGMATMCVLALLLLLLLVAPPRVLREWRRLFLRLRLLETAAARVLPAAPSLHVLCISRT